MKTRTAASFVPTEPLEVLEVSVVRTFGTFWRGDRIETSRRDRDQLLRLVGLRRSQARKAAGIRDSWLVGFPLKNLEIIHLKPTSQFENS